jgi:hypothetical protein
MRALRGLALAGLCWRWWMIAAALELALAFPPALLWHEWLRGALASRYEPGELFANLSTCFRFDQRAGLGELNTDASLWLGFAALLAMLLGVFFAGGWAQLAFDGQEGKVVARAGSGARHFFWRYVRVWLATLVLLALWSWVLFDWPWKKVVLDWILRLPDASGDRLEALTSEWSAVAVRVAQAGIYAIGVALLLCCADYARLRIAWKDGRSAIAGWFGALWMVGTSPFRTLAPLAAIFVFEVAIVAVASWLSRRSEGQIGAHEAGLRTVALLAATTAVLALLRCWLRGSRYLAAAEVVRESVPAPQRSGAGLA